MEIKKKYLQKYLPAIAVEQLAEDYQNRGYKVSRNVVIGDFSVDLVAQNNDETIVFEIKSGRLSDEKKVHIEKLADYIQSKPNYRFLVVIATPPVEKKLNIDDIDLLLFDHLMNNFPEELDILSTHTRLENVTNINIDEIKVGKDKIFVKGNGEINVELQSGSDGDQDRGDGFIDFADFPFDFEIHLVFDEAKKRFASGANAKIQIDTSEYYS